MRGKGLFSGQITIETKERPKVKGEEVMKNYGRIETKEIILLGVEVREEEIVDQREGSYTKKTLLCANCDEDLTELLESNDINYCPICGQNLISGKMPTFDRS